LKISGYRQTHRYRQRNLVDQTHLSEVVAAVAADCSGRILNRISTWQSRKNTHYQLFQTQTSVPGVATNTAKDDISAILAAMLRKRAGAPLGPESDKNSQLVQTEEEVYDFKYSLLD